MELVIGRNLALVFDIHITRPDTPEMASVIGIDTVEADYKRQQRALSRERQHQRDAQLAMSWWYGLY